MVLGDGGYVLELEKRGYVIAGPFTPEVVLDHPEAVRQMHREFIRSGSEVIQAFAFYASREKLANVGYGEKVLDLNRQAVKIAREVAGDDVSGRRQPQHNMVIQAGATPTHDKSPDASSKSSCVYRSTRVSISSSASSSSISKKL